MKKYLAIFSILALLIFGGIAYASIPDSSGVIHGCYKNSTGSLKVIDDSSQTCASGETALNWNQTGPQGATGPQGPQGPSGLNAVTQVDTHYTVPAESSPTHLNFISRCPESATQTYSPLSGGFEANLPDPSLASVEISAASTDGSGQGGWLVGLVDNSPTSFSLTVHVYCISPKVNTWTGVDVTP